MIRFYSLFFIFGLSISFLINNAESRSLERIKRMIGGKVDRFHDIKYVVYIGRDGGYFCTGSIIHEQFVVTAAHCVVDESTNYFYTSNYYIIAGTSDRKNLTDSVSTVVEKIYVPSMYKPLQSRSGDIAVLKLAQTLDLNNPRISKLELPLPIYKNGYADVNEGLTGIVSGYGFYTNFQYSAYEKDNSEEVVTSRTGTPSLELRWGYSTIENQNHCSIKYDFPFNDNQMCAKMYSKKDIHRGPCAGDSGGPFAYGNTLVAVVNFGSPICDDRQMPEAYTRVAYFVDFIVHAIADNYNFKDLRSYVPK